MMNHYCRRNPAAVGILLNRNDFIQKLGEEAAMEGGFNVSA
jgi:hypothetical protein